MAPAGGRGGSRRTASEHDVGAAAVGCSRLMTVFVSQPVPRWLLTYDQARGVRLHILALSFVCSFWLPE